MIAVAVPIATLLVLGSFTIGGAPMWLVGVRRRVHRRHRATRRSPCTGPSCSRPATAGCAAGLLTTSALLGGIVGLLLVGHLLDRDWSYGSVIGLVALGQVVVVSVVLTRFPETAHRELEDLNPEDAAVAT